MSATLQSKRVGWALVGCVLGLSAGACGDSDDEERRDAGADAADGGPDAARAERDAGGLDAADAGRDAGRDAGPDAAAGDDDAGVITGACEPNEARACYDGADGTAGVGPCLAGTQTCASDGSGFGACVGQVLPALDVCANGIDEDCNGTPDDDLDEDADGWSRCGGDCCDTVADGCSDPASVNPGAFDYPGDALDDDCSGGAAAAASPCDGALTSNSGDALDYARAMDLCQTAQMSPPTPVARRWGVVSAAFALADGTGTPHADARSIRATFGAATPRSGGSLAVLSSGRAAATGQTSPAYVAFESGADNGTQSAPPADWLAANGGAMPVAAGCPAAANGASVYDPVLLRVQIRVPTNARSFSLRQAYFSSDFPEGLCGPYVDRTVTLLDSSFSPGSGEVANPADKNLAVNASVTGAASAFPLGAYRQCVNGTVGCAVDSVEGTVSTCTGNSMLVGSGFDDFDAPCGETSQVGGSTDWLTTSGNVTPGEIITLRFSVWDTGDHGFDSLVLLDGFEWHPTTTTPGTL